MNVCTLQEFIVINRLQITSAATSEEFQGDLVAAASRFVRRRGNTPHPGSDHPNLGEKHLAVRYGVGVAVTICCW